ncbi:sepiapterin reductase-like [Fopius arisanus]|uniref:Sepiapterin reductase n=1 Tax=Fopius arisanus TaxID=64838 RepID=A0A9R1TVG3_9HYME|nr:PREDICTED: sepiapterin reductase-like [Fopius arisanus]
MGEEIFSGKVFVLITGASQGIGRQIAITFSGLLGKGSKLLLLARSEKGLKETAGNIPKGISVDFQGIDLSLATAGQLSEIIEKSVESVQLDRVIIVHNVGTMGDTSKLTVDMDDFEEWRKYYDLNVFSPAVLNSVAMKLFREKVERIFVVNITTFSALKSAGYYCSGKAAREMYFKVFAEEYPDVNVLNYSPGPVETNMLRNFSATAGHPDQRKKINYMIAQNQQLTPEQTADRLVKVLREQKYQSGGRVDYYDGMARPSHRQ